MARIIKPVGEYYGSALLLTLGPGIMGIALEENALLVELATTPEIVAQGVAEVEDVGDGLLCITFYRRQNAERVVSGRLIITAHALLAGRPLADAAIAGCPPECAARAAH